MMISKPDRYESPRRKLSQVFDQNKDDGTPTSRRTIERAKNHSMNSSSFSSQWWQHEHQDSMARSTLVESEGYRLFQNLFFFQRIRVQPLSYIVNVTRREHRTFHCTYSQFSLTCTTDHHTHPRVVHWPDVSSLGFVSLWRILRVVTFGTCFIDHSLMCLTHCLPFVPYHVRLHPLHCFCLE